MEKKKVIISYRNLSEDVLKAVHDKYPDGFKDHVIKVNKGVDDYFYAISVETEDTKYLVKVDVVIDRGLEYENDESIPAENEIEEIKDLDEFSEEDVD